MNGFPESVHYRTCCFLPVRSCRTPPNGVMTAIDQKLAPGRPGRRAESGRPKRRPACRARDPRQSPGHRRKPLRDRHCRCPESGPDTLAVPGSGCPRPARLFPGHGACAAGLAVSCASCAQAFVNERSGPPARAGNGLPDNHEYSFAVHISFGNGRFSGRAPDAPHGAGPAAVIVMVHARLAVDAAPGPLLPRGPARAGPTQHRQQNTVVGTSLGLFRSRLRTIRLRRGWLRRGLAAQ
jgi:hypothetical protein